jgi:hypothetical protein
VNVTSTIPALADNPSDNLLKAKFIIAIKSGADADSGPCTALGARSRSKSASRLKQCGLGM